MPEAAVNTRRAINAARSFFAAYDEHDVNGMLAACHGNAELRYVPMGSDGQGEVHSLGKPASSIRSPICTLRFGRCSVTSGTSRPR